LRASEANLARAQRVARLGSWEWIIGTGKINWSDEIYRIFGLTPDLIEQGLSHKALINQVHPDDRKRVKKIKELAWHSVKEPRYEKDDDEPYNIEYRIIRGDGMVLYVNERVEVIFDAENQPVRIIGTVQDITERIQVEKEMATLQEEIHEKNKLAAVGQLAAGVAHELNTPLMNIDFTVEYISSLVDGDSTIDREQLRVEFLDIQKQVQYCANIVKGLLQFSRKIDLLESTFPVRHLLEDIVKSHVIASRLQEKGIELILELDESLVISGDMNLLLQVFQNIINNAIDALNGVKNSPAIKIVSSIDGELVTIKIIDNGEGISEEDLDKVFEPFFTTKSSGEGTGLGLSISKSIIEKHGGKIVISSIVDKGTEVEVQLPTKRTVNTNY
ncbi:MAG: sensor histidine kinase, partial [Candidatus Odinarchaeota archaeon]